MAKIKITKNSFELIPTKPWEKISVAGLVAGFLSGGAAIIGIPLDEEARSTFFLKILCETSDGGFRTKCDNIIMFFSLIFLVIGIWIIYENAKKIKEWRFRYRTKNGFEKNIRIPGMIIGILLYVITSGIGFLIALKLFS